MGGAPCRPWASLTSLPVEQCIARYLVVILVEAVRKNFSNGYIKWVVQSPRLGRLAAEERSSWLLFVLKFPSRKVLFK
jgi:hypothetical protein